MIGSLDCSKNLAIGVDSYPLVNVTGRTHHDLITEDERALAPFQRDFFLYFSSAEGWGFLWEFFGARLLFFEKWCSRGELVTEREKVKLFRAR